MQTGRAVKVELVKYWNSRMERWFCIRLTFEDGTTSDRNVTQDLDEAHVLFENARAWVKEFDGREDEEVLRRYEGGVSS